MKWKDFKLDPPYDAKEDEENGLETDRTHAWFVYRHTHRTKWPMNQGPILSYKACEFYDGIFTEYKSHMRTSPYEIDWIEILYWLDAEEVRSMLMKNFKEVNVRLHKDTPTV